MDSWHHDQPRVVRGCARGNVSGARSISSVHRVHDVSQHCIMHSWPYRPILFLQWGNPLLAELGSMLSQWVHQVKEKGTIFIGQPKGGEVRPLAPPPWIRHWQRQCLRTLLPIAGKHSEPQPSGFLCSITALPSQTLKLPLLITDSMMVPVLFLRSVFTLLISQCNSSAFQSLL